jgi:hypothetical protein
MEAYQRGRLSGLVAAGEIAQGLCDGWRAEGAALVKRGDPTGALRPRGCAEGAERVAEAIAARVLWAAAITVEEL